MESRADGKKNDWQDSPGKKDKSIDTKMARMLSNKKNVNWQISEKRVGGDEGTLIDIDIVPIPSENNSCYLRSPFDLTSTDQSLSLHA